MRFGFKFSDVKEKKKNAEFNNFYLYFLTIGRCEDNFCMCVQKKKKKEICFLVLLYREHAQIKSSNIKKHCPNE